VTILLKKRLGKRKKQVQPNAQDAVKQTFTLPTPGDRATEIDNPPRPLVVLIESDPAQRAELARLLRTCGLDVVEPELGAAFSIPRACEGASAIITDFELGMPDHHATHLTGLDIALNIARRARRRIPTLVTSSRFGRRAIPACKPHGFVVLFKPLDPGELSWWFTTMVPLPAEQPLYPAQMAGRILQGGQDQPGLEAALPPPLAVPAQAAPPAEGRANLAIA